MKKMLIVYYSWSNGNTKWIAEQLQDATGADLASIETQVPYQGTYDEVVEQGKREVNEKYEPLINPLAYEISDYDMIAIGTPTWWYTMAPAVLTFIHSQDWKGKTVIPFMTNGGWPGHVIADIKKECKGATCVLEKAIQFDAEGKDHLETPIKEITDWIETIRQTLVDE